MGGYGRGRSERPSGRVAGGYGGWEQAPPRSAASRESRMRPYDGSMAGLGSDREHVDLVTLIKDAQRSGTEWKDKWNGYCTEHGNGTMDPSRHTTRFLLSAVKCLGLPGGLGTGSVSRMVEEIKERQRTSPQQHEAWTTYCDQNGQDGRYDPAFYDKNFLQDALFVLRGYDDTSTGSNIPSGPARGGSGRRGKGGGTGMVGVSSRGGQYHHHNPPPHHPHPQNHNREGSDMPLAEYMKNRGDTLDDLVEKVKTMQKEDAAAHASWQEFCETRADGTLDPRRHEYEFLVAGITFMRRSLFYVNTIREMTRSHPERVRWVQYCDECGDGVYDPMLHNTDFLEAAYNAIAPRPGKKGHGGSDPARFIKFSSSTSEALEAGVDESDLVTSLRLLQKEHPEISMAWKVYCDQYGEGTYDPSRHTPRFLQDAINEIREQCERSREVRE